jgi:DNA-binding LacI/PurR family transcriptional regulator
MSIEKISPEGKITIKDVSQMAGVSQTTVSWVLSGNKLAERISNETKERIFAAVKTLGYKRSSVGASLQRGYTDTVVFLAVTWDLANSHAGTAAWISRTTAQAGLSTILHIAADDQEAIEFLDRISSIHPYGLLLLWDSEGMDTNRLSRLRERGLPIIDLVPSMMPSIVSVTADRESGFFKLTNHLLTLGHTRIGILLDTSSRWRTSNAKLAGYKQALHSADIEFDANIVQEVHGFGFSAGYDGIKELLSKHPDISGVVCINDPTALGAIAAAQDMGLTVPDDISIAGYGAHDEGSYFRPKLTTIAPAFVKTAEKAITLLRKMREEKSSDPQSVYVPVELVVRESTGRKLRGDSF